MDKSIEASNYYVGGTGLKIEKATIAITALEALENWVLLVEEAKEVVEETKDLENLEEVEEAKEVEAILQLMAQMQDFAPIDHTIDIRPLSISQAVISPIGRWIALIAGNSYSDEEIIVWNLEENTGFNLTENFGKRQCYGRLCWSPDGESIAVPLKKVGEPGHDLWVFQLAPRKEFLICQKWVESIWSPDGKQIACVSEGKTILVANRDGSNSRVITRTSRYPIFDLSWIQVYNSLKLAFLSGWPNANQEAWITSLDGSDEVKAPNPIFIAEQSIWRCFDPSFYHRPGGQIFRAVPGGYPDSQPSIPFDSIVEIYLQSHQNL